MAGVRIEVDADFARLERAAERIAALGKADLTPLKEGIGAEVESQSRRRIEEEKTSPDGEPWPEWSPRYALTRHGGHSLLMGGSEDPLIDSVQYLIAGDRIEVGSDLVYAAIHQFGGAEVGMPGLPAREYLGLSVENLADVEALVEDYVDGLLEAM